MSVRQGPHLMHRIIKGLVVAGLLVARLAPSAQADVYWTNTVSPGTIGSAPLYGGVGNPSFIPGLFGYPEGIAVYGTSIYWANTDYTPTSGAIGRVGLDGTDVNGTFVTGADYPAQVAVNGSHIYWTTSCFQIPPNFKGFIGSAPLSGGVGTIILDISQCSLGLAVDEQYIYWGDQVVNAAAGSYGIFRANLDGTGATLLIPTGVYDPSAIAVNHTYIYWSSVDTNTISRANLDGTDVLEGLIPGANGTGVAVDGTYLYWPGIGGIGRAKLDGTDLNQNFITSTSSVMAPYSVAVSPVPTCGLGIEPVPILAALLWLRGRRRRKPAEPDVDTRRRGVTSGA